MTALEEHPSDQDEQALHTSINSIKLTTATIIIIIIIIISNPYILLLVIMKAVR